MSVNDNKIPVPVPSPSGSFTMPSSPAMSFSELDDSDDSAEVAASYTEKCRKIMELYNRLVALGANMILEIPQIVVIGGQSAGKSSLVEAVSKIQVPRDSGTCTRCAFQFTLSSDVGDLPTGVFWSCKIDLRFEYKMDGTERPTSRTVEFASTTNPDDVEINLRRAQLAILSGDTIRDVREMPLEAVKVFPVGTAGVAAFSKNTVVVTIRAPDVTDLTFVDLPGLIHNAEQRQIDVVQDLVKSKITKPKTLILVTIPMTEDMQRQEAVQFAKHADRGGARTIGVLTKPDALSVGDSGQRENWRQVLLDKSSRLNHGYFCVRLRNDEERKRDDDINELTNDLLASDSYWRDLKALRPDRIGIDKMVTYLGPLLVQMFEESIPEMKLRVQKLVSEREHHLRLLGNPPVIDNAPLQVLGLVTQFRIQLEHLVNGTGMKESKKMLQKNQEYYRQHRYDILATCPRFETSGMPHLQNLPVYTDADTKAHMDKSTTVFSQNDLERIIKENTDWQLPGEIPLEATRDLVERFTSQWAAPTEACFDNVAKNTSDFILGLVNTVFCPDGRHVPALIQHINILLRREISAVTTEAKSIVVKQVAAWENPHKLFTLNPEFVNVKASLLAERNRYSLQPGQTTEQTDVMTKVLAYFQVAHKRRIDQIPLSIEGALLAALPERLTNVLFKNLSNANLARKLFAEDLSISRKRTYHAERLERLQAMRAELDKIKVAVAPAKPAIRKAPLSPREEVPVPSMPTSRAPSPTPSDY
ncbi:hypothetical protein CYLTODRAFT_486540 [Cylindrobasidium torrendii FP15055 ss-10]|uniref:P-loop containing nucleoside triphosphate hydrolase protein n=1 Tax=Cylindrobasidium torrendii FP15055 ss-10 TaxID=1314674 RepID=A0A0D7BPM4_9AGAR|nr:hypothetical protein CYLTODRAFT_486540 [Cylindrobasidium torrendii FP15055 ss-10]